MTYLLGALPQLPISYTTIVSALLLIMFFFVGLKKGILSSVLSLVRIAAAITGAVFIAPYIASWLNNLQFIQNMGVWGPKLVSLLSVFLAGLAIYVVLGLIFRWVNKMVKEIPIVGSVNKILGGVFQILIGFGVIVLITFFMSIFGSEVGFIKTIMEDAQTDAFGRFLFDNNLITQVLDLIKQYIPQAGEIIDSITSSLPKVSGMC